MLWMAIAKNATSQRGFRHLKQELWILKTLIWIAVLCFYFSMLGTKNIRSKNLVILVPHYLRPTEIEKWDISPLTGEELHPHSQNKTKKKKAMGTTFPRPLQSTAKRCCHVLHGCSQLNCLVVRAPARSTTCKGNVPFPPRKDSSPPLTTRSTPLSDSGSCYWHHPGILSKQRFKIHLP